MILIIVLSLLSFSSTFASSDPSDDNVPEESYNAYLAFPIRNPEFAQLSEDLLHEVRVISNEYYLHWEQVNIPGKYEQRLLDLHVKYDEWNSLPQILDSKLFHEFCEFMPYNGTYGGNISQSLEFEELYGIDSPRKEDNVNFRFTDFGNSAARRHRIVSRPSYNKTRVLEVQYPRGSKNSVRYHHMAKRMETIKSPQRRAYIDRLYLCRGSQSKNIPKTSKFCDVIKEMNFNYCPSTNAPAPSNYYKKKKPYYHTSNKQIQLEFDTDVIVFTGFNFGKTEYMVTFKMKNPQNETLFYDLNSFNQIFRYSPEIGYIKPGETVDLQVTFYRDKLSVPKSGVYFLVVHYSIADGREKEFIREYNSPVFVRRFAGYDVAKDFYIYFDTKTAGYDAKKEEERKEDMK